MENAHANNFNKAKCGKDCNQIGRLRGGIFYWLIVFGPAMAQARVPPVYPLFVMSTRLQNLRPRSRNAAFAFRLTGIFPLQLCNAERQYSGCFRRSGPCGLHGAETVASQAACRRVRFPSPAPIFISQRASHPKKAKWRCQQRLPCRSCRPCFRCQTNTAWSRRIAQGQRTAWR